MLFETLCGAPHVGCHHLSQLVIHSEKSHHELRSLPDGEELSMHVVNQSMIPFATCSSKPNGISQHRKSRKYRGPETRSVHPLKRGTRAIALSPSMITAVRFRYRVIVDNVLWPSFSMNIHRIYLLKASRIQAYLCTPLAELEDRVYLSSRRISH